jgi:hypothetical protein
MNPNEASAYSSRNTFAPRIFHSAADPDQDARRGSLQHLELVKGNVLHTHTGPASGGELHEQVLASS